MDRADSPKVRRDGWTPERQLRFLDALTRTRSVTKAACAAGMSRESAYRLRSRRDGALFAATWDRIMRPRDGRRPESHSCELSDGRLARLLGTHYRRERGNFAIIGASPAESVRR